MDKSGKPDDGSNPAKFPWQENEASTDMGATGVFGVGQSKVGRGSGTIPQTDKDILSEKREDSSPNAPNTPIGLQEPIVHKVVLGGSATAPVNLLEIMRTIPTAESSPAAPESASEGLTQLFRALTGDASTASASATKSGPEMQTGVAPMTRSSGDISRPDAPVPIKDTSSTDEVPAKHNDIPVSPSGDGVGGFTSLLQGISGTGITTATPTSQPPTISSDATTQSTPGAFTQLFSAISSEPANPTTPEKSVAKSPVNNLTGPYKESTGSLPPTNDESSFTQLISNINSKSLASSLSPDNRDIGRGNVSHMVPFLHESPQETHQPLTGDWLTPVRRSTPEPPPADLSLTKIFNKLEQPFNEPEPFKPPKGSDIKQPSSSAGIFTETYDRLIRSAEHPSSAPSVRDATPIQPSPAPVPQFQHPQLNVPTPPSPSGIPQPAWAMPTPPYVPPQPSVQISQSPPAPVPQAPAIGKMQQYVPLLMMIIIFLLVVIFITMIFMLKR